MAFLPFAIRVLLIGEKVNLSLYLSKKYSFDPGDGYPVLMGWFRFVCRNGLIIGVTRSDVRCRHVGDLRLVALPF